MVIQLLPCSLFNKGQRKRVWAPSDDTAGWVYEQFSVEGLIEARWSFEMV